MLAIDPTPGFFVHSQIARISVARTGERTMMREADLAAMDRIIRPTGELDPCRRVAPAPRRAARVIGAGRSGGRSRGETFPACKSLKSLKMELESAMVRFVILPHLGLGVSLHFHDLAIRISAQLGGRRKPFVE
jgi:hypothetical protein